MSEESVVRDWNIYVYICTYTTILPQRTVTYGILSWKKVNVVRDAELYICLWYERGKCGLRLKYICVHICTYTTILPLTELYKNGWFRRNCVNNVDSMYRRVLVRPYIRTASGENLCTI